MIENELNASALAGILKGSESAVSQHLEGLRQLRLIQVVLCVCLVSLMMSLFIDNLEKVDAWSNMEGQGENHASPYVLHPHHHEEEFVVPVLWQNLFPIIATIQGGEVCITANSCAPTPLLPPPKFSTL